MNAQDPNDQARLLIYQLIYLLAAYPDIVQSLNELAARTPYLDLEGNETITAQRELQDEGFNELCILERAMIERFVQSSDTTQAAADNFLGKFQKFTARWQAQQIHVQNLVAASELCAAENEQLTATCKLLQQENTRLNSLLEGAK